MYPNIPSFFVLFLIKQYKLWWGCVVTFKGTAISFNEMKNENYHTVKTVPKFNLQTTETEAKAISPTHI